MAGTGPVDVDGLGTVTADNVVDLTINRAYIDFPNRDQRQELLGDVARKAFDALINGEFSSLRPLGDALFKTAQQRHIIFVPNDPTIRQEVDYFGADGALPPADAQDYALLTVQNFSKNKLDYYIDSRLDIVGTRPIRTNRHGHRDDHGLEHRAERSQVVVRLRPELAWRDGRPVPSGRLAVPPDRCLLERFVRRADLAIPGGRSGGGPDSDHLWRGRPRWREQDRHRAADPGASDARCSVLAEGDSRAEGARDPFERRHRCG